MPRDHSYECETCGIYRGGLNDVPCDCDVSVDLPESLVFALSEGGEEFLHAMWTLGANLKIAGALCRAFELGHRYADDLWDVTAHRTRWRHGSGRSAP